MIKAGCIKDAHRGNHIRDRAGCESATREADQDDIVSIVVVIADKVVNLADVLNTMSVSASETQKKKQEKHTRTRPKPNIPPVNCSNLDPLLPTPGWYK